MTDHEHGDWDQGGYCNVLVMRHGHGDVCGHRPTPTCSCHESALNPCPTHGELRDQVKALRARLDTNRNDPARSALYDAVGAYEQVQRKADRDAAAAARRERDIVTLAEVFRVGWHRADELGLPDRTHHGIRAVLEAQGGK